MSVAAAAHKFDFDCSILSYVSERPKLEKRWMETLQKTHVPICLFHGPADPILPFQETKALYGKYLPNINVRKLDDSVGHYPHLEHPENLLNAYVDFLNEVAGLDIPNELPVVVPEKVPMPSADLS